MRSSAGAGLLLCLLSILVSGHGGLSHAEAREPDLSGIWWAVESFTYPDGRRENWEYVISIRTDGDRLTISDGDGMSLTGALINGTSVLRGSYPWGDGTVGHYALTLHRRGADSLDAVGSCVNHDGNGQPIPGAPGLVSFVLTRLGEPELREEKARTAQSGRKSRACEGGDSEAGA